MKTEFHIPEHLLTQFDIGKIQERMHRADWYYEYSEDRQVWQRGRQEINGIKNDLQVLCQLEEGRAIANVLWGAYVPDFSIVKPTFLLNDHLSLQNIKIMNEKNLDYLGKQIKFTGFGEGHQENLKAKLEEGKPEFVLAHQQDFGQDKVVATMQFAKSETSDNYFFNRYQVVLKTSQQEDPVKQTIYLNNMGDNITLKEAYNLLSGRAVFKEFANKEGEKYQAWAQLDFKAIDKHGNFEMKKFNQNYGFDLGQVLAKLPLKELSVEADRKMLTESLERGNRQSVTFQVEGRDQKVFIEAAPQYKAMNFYDNSMKRVMVQTLLSKVGEGQTEKQAAQEIGQEKGQAAGDEEAPGKAESKKRVKKQGVSLT